VPANLAGGGWEEPCDGTRLRPCRDRTPEDCRGSRNPAYLQARPRRSSEANAAASARDKWMAPRFAEDFHCDIGERHRSDTPKRKVGGKRTYVSYIHHLRRHRRS
jgi:hypothetical protein